MVLRLNEEYGERCILRVTCPDQPPVFPPSNTLHETHTFYLILVFFRNRRAQLALQ